MLELLSAAQLGKRVALLDYVAPSPLGEFCGGRILVGVAVVHLNVVTCLQRALSQIIWSAGDIGPEDQYLWGLWSLGSRSLKSTCR